jgi:hypothetical protein
MKSEPKPHLFPLLSKQITPHVLAETQINNQNINYTLPYKNYLNE